MVKNLRCHSVICAEDDVRVCKHYVVAFTPLAMICDNIQRSVTVPYELSAL